MCGIVGKIIFGPQRPDLASLRRQLNTLIHRGPDDEGLHRDTSIGLGQRRLSIIDLRPIASPPIFNENRTACVVFNGEIYNFFPLRRELEAKGHKFQTDTDTEVIIHAYEEFGTNCVDHFNGMFAIAVWDKTLGRLFLARDRFGKKPLYYSHCGSCLVFGSEIKAVTADEKVTVAPSSAGLAEFMNRKYVPSPLTAFENIFALEPSSAMTVDVQGQIKKWRYWTPPTRSPEPISITEAKAGLYSVLKDAVARRMISDVPLGAFLSGGLDSSTIVSLMANLSTSPVKTFSIGFEEEEFNELPFARLLADRYQTDHFEFTVKPDFEDLLPELVEQYNQPYADPSAIPTYYVAKMARQEVTVAITGDGGDEVFGGYDHYDQTLRWSVFDMFPHSVRSRIFGLAHDIMNPLRANNNVSKVRRALKMLGGDWDSRYNLQLTLIKPDENEQLVKRSFIQAAQDEFVGLHFLDRQVKRGDDEAPLSYLMRHDQNFYLPECLNVKVDVASMANSLETRAPFMDLEVVNFSASLPSDFMVRAGMKKWILRETFGPHLPAELLGLPKRGFSIPLAKWLRTDLAGLMNDTLLDGRLIGRGFLDERYLARMVHEQVESKRDWSARLWGLMMMEMWFRRFID